MSTKFLSPGWRMPRNANQSKSTNYSLNFDGGSYINLGNSSLGLTANSISIWFKTSSTTSGQQLLSKYGSTYQFQFRLETNGTITLYSFENQSTFATLQSASGYNDGNWHNVITTFNTTDGHKMYVDGNTTPVDTDTVNKSALQSSSERMLIGVRDSSTGVIDTARYFNGDISFISIFDYALSASQITTLYGDSTNGPGNPMALPSPPIAYYPLGTSAWNGQYLAENNAIGDYVFDNTVSSRIFTNINVSNLTNCTQAVWFKTSTNGQSNKQIFYVGQYGTFVLQLNGTDSLRAGVTVNPLTQTYPSLTFNYADGKWHQYIMNYDGSNIKLYIDGVLKIKTARTGTLRDEPTYFTAIGNSSNTNSNAGAIGEYSNFIAYEHTLTDGGISVGDTATGEIETLYNYGSPIQTLANIPQSSNLKAWYKLDASEIYNGSSTEWSVDNNANTSAYANSLSFNGTSDYIDCGNNSSLVPSSLTISLWFKTSGSASAIPRLLNKSYGGSPYDSYFIRINNGVLNFKIGVSSASVQIAGTTNVVDGIWHHVVGTYDGSQLKLYLDGNPEATPINETRAILENTTYNLTIGCELGAYGFSWPFTGDISNVAIYNTALSATNVSTLYNNGAPQATIYGSPVSHWKLDNTTTGIEDSAGSNNGTNNGATEYAGFVNTLAGESSGMTQANLVQSDLQTVAPYSRYALDFDVTDKISLGSSVDLGINSSISLWINMPNTPTIYIPLGEDSYLADYLMYISSTLIYIVIGNVYKTYTHSFNTNEWYNIVIVRQGDSIEVFKNNTSLGTQTGFGTSVTTKIDTIGAKTNGNNSFIGSISNVSTWNAALTSTQVTEIYNQGLPSNLNSHSAYSNLVSWWQLGENSSFDGNDWIVADEKGTKDGTSTGMPVGALTNGVGTTANGVSSGMAVGALVGDAPYSTANAISSGMAVTAKGTDVPS